VIGLPKEIKDNEYRGGLTSPANSAFFTLTSDFYFRLYASTPAARIFIARARSSQLST
jgi:hypothetical protein